MSPAVASVPVLSRDPIGAGQRDAGHGGGFDGQRGEVLRLEIMKVRLAASTGQGLRLHCQHRQEIADAPCAFLDIEPAFERGVLRRDADRAASGVAMVASAWLSAESVVIFDMDRAV